MAYQPLNFDNLLGLEGFSDEILLNHFSLYQGYIANTNKLIELINYYAKENKIDTPEFAELNRRFGWEFNGIRLHELYFGSLIKGGIALNSDSELLKKIQEDFESFENWEKQFKSMGAMRGIGWVILYYDISANKLFNVWINEHDKGHLAGCNPLLIMDVFEHAYMIDYGTKKAGYIDAFFKSVNWQAVSDRLSK